jgi:hypothetical protein
MPQTCTICKHPQRLQIEQALLNRNTYRHIAKHFGTSTTALVRHRDHIVDTLARQTAERDTARNTTLLEDIRTGEGRAERLYQQAEEILRSALADQDRRTALQAVRAAIDVMGEARGYLELRGELTQELGRDRNSGPVCVQIVCPGITPGGPMPMITYQAQADPEVVEIGLLQRS